MSSLDLYCATCGAANATDETICFACGKTLLDAENENEREDSLDSKDSSMLLNNRYRKLWQVGEGGFAKVYRAEDLDKKRVVAIKAISLKELKPQEIIDATDTYNREIHFGTTLRHRFLPEVYDSFMDTEHWYIVAEFIDGQTLEEQMQRLPDKRLPIWDVLEIGVQLCDVLSYLHTRQPPIIFRDIKPDNIMHTTNGRIYLVDFGIARRFRPGVRRDTQALGSPGYAAPEQYGSAQTTEQSDIYSLGATLKALLTGVNPLEALTEPEQPGLMPAKLSALLAHMLEKEPEKRPADVEKIRQELMQIAHQQGIVLRHTGRSTTTDKLATSVFSSTPLNPPTPRPIFPASSAPAKTSRTSYTLQKTVQWVKAVGLTVLILGGVFGSLGLFNSVGMKDQKVPAVATVTPKLFADKESLILPADNSDVIRNLDPAGTVDLQESQILHMLYAGLVQLDDAGQVKPQLATSWKQEADGLTWTFTLREDFKFSNGKQITAEDVVYSIDRALDPDTRSSSVQLYLMHIKDAEKRLGGSLPTLIGKSLLAPDTKTVKIITESKIAFLPYTLTCICASVVDKEFIEDYGSSFTNYLVNGGTSGPYKVARRTVERLELVVNPYYHRASPAIKSVTFLIFDHYSAYTGYLDNKIAVADVPYWRAYEASKRADYHKESRLWINYYAMNYLVKPFDNIKIRQAFALALNKELLLTSAGMKDAAFPTHHIIPEGQTGYNADLKGPAGVDSLHRNAILAKKLLEEGMKEEGIASVRDLPPITLSVQEDVSTIIEESRAAQQMWQKVLGISVHVQELPYDELLMQTDGSRGNEHGLQIWRADWIADYPDPQNWTTPHFGANALRNETNYGQNNSAAATQQQQIQALLQKADGISDPEEREAAYQQAEQALVNDVAWIPLYQLQDSYLVKSEVSGYNLNPMYNIPPDAWANMSIK